MATVTQSRRVNHAGGPTPLPVDVDIDEGERIRVELDGLLEGHFILIDPDELTFGLLEDLQSADSFSTILSALSAAIVGGNLPKGNDRAGLRRLKPTEMKFVMQGVSSAIEIPKS